MSAPSRSVPEAMALVQAGAIPEAYRLLEQAVERGDGEAAITLAEWRLSGQLVRRDIGAARDFYGRAADLGTARATPIHIALLANGAGGSGRRWREALAALRRIAPANPAARTQLALLDRMPIDADGEPAALPAAKRLCDDPAIVELPGLLDEEERRYVADRATPMMQPSVVIDPATGRTIRDPVRTCQSAGFPFVLEDPVLHAINRRIAKVTATTCEQGEPLQVLRYAPGEHYRLHSDTLSPPANQRVLTVLVRLNDGYEGGETLFPKLGIRWAGRAGDALVFANIRRDGSPHPLSWHSGEPVRSGTKLLLSKWIRAEPLDLAGPPGRPL
jgi:prolyl 4-hydroxylase